MTIRVQVRPADPFATEATQLISRLSAELAAVYPEYPNSGAGNFRPADATGPGSDFLIAWLNNRPVGCGAVRPMEPGVAEIKRMYVEPEVRGRGIARLILEALERRSRELGYVVVRLETGLRQPAAVRLYESTGYFRISNYDIYVGNPLSACYEKRLA
ncbi:MAG TPA: GNAT family N-acetyltransferase [Gemmataceae bacterium]|nr:GNAT family N-acetyltransferase [Gemmataceae bacterium]